MSKVRLNNKRKKNPNEVTKCPKCGAILLSEICSFCGTYIGEVSSRDLTAEYPTVECNLAKLTFISFAFPIIFGGGFGYTGYEMIASSMASSNANMKYVISISIPLLIIGLGCAIFALKQLWEALSNLLFGTVLEGTVYGYLDDLIAQNGKNLQRVKILVHASSGYKFVIIPLNSGKKLYEVNSKVYVRLYKNYGLVLRKKVVNTNDK